MWIPHTVTTYDPKIEEFDLCLHGWNKISDPYVCRELSKRLFSSVYVCASRSDMHKFMQIYNYVV